MSLTAGVYVSFFSSLVKITCNKAIAIKDKNTYFNLGVALINSETQEEHKVYFEKAYKLKENELTYEAYIDFQGY